MYYTTVVLQNPEKLHLNNIFFYSYSKLHRQRLFIWRFGNEIACQNDSTFQEQLKQLSQKEELTVLERVGVSSVLLPRVLSQKVRGEEMRSSTFAARKLGKILAISFFFLCVTEMKKARKRFTKYFFFVAEQ